MSWRHWEYIWWQLSPGDKRPHFGCSRLVWLSGPFHPKSGLCSDQLIHQLKLTFGHRSTTTPISLWPMQIGKTVLILAQPLTAYPPSPKPKPSHCIVYNLTISPNKTKPLPPTFSQPFAKHLSKRNQANQPLDLIYLDF